MAIELLGATQEEILGAYELLGDEILGAPASKQQITQFRNQRSGGSGPSSGRAVAVVDREPTRARDYPLGFDSVTTVAAAATANITSRPQVVFRPDRIVIPASIADNFLIADIKVGKNSQLASAGNLPAACFVAGAFDVKLKLDTCQIAMDIVMSVINISGGALRFVAALIGPAVE